LLACLLIPVWANAQVTISAFSGADACAQINAAQAALPAHGGVVDARGFQGVITCAASFSVGTATQAVQLLLGSVELKVQTTVTLAQGSQITGLSGGGGSSGTTPTTISAGASFPANTVLVQWNTTGTSDGIKLSDLQVNCNSVNGSVGIDTNNSQDISTISRVFVLNCVANDIQISGSSQAVGIYDTSTLASSVAGASAHNGLTIGSNSDHVTLVNVGFSKQGTQSTGAGIKCTACNIYVHGMHVEDHADGVLLAGAGNGSPTIIGINALNNITNTVHIASSWTSSAVILGVRKFSATTAVRNDIPAFNHSCSDENLGEYVLGSTVTSLQSLYTTCSSIPSHVRPNFYIGDADIAPDTAAALYIRTNTANFDSMHLENTGLFPRKIAVGPNAGGGAQFGIYDATARKQLLTLSWVAPFTAGFSGLVSTPGTTLSLSTSAIPANTCAAAQTANITGLTTAGVVHWSFASTPVGVIGYGTGALQISTFATANTANVVVCNITAGSVTPGAMTLNLRGEL